MESGLPTGIHQAANWNKLTSYVEEITTGVKDDDDPRFVRPVKKDKKPLDCFPKMCFVR